MKKVVQSTLLLLTFFSTPLYAQITSGASGNWSAGSTWVGGVVPVATDDVIIADGHTVTLDTIAAECNVLTINGSNATVRFAIDGTSSLLTVRGNLNILSGGRLRVENRNPAGTANSFVEHRLVIHGDLTNNGTLDLRGGSATGGTSNGVLVTFAGLVNSTVSLHYSTYTSTSEEFNGVTINKTGGAKVILDSGNLFMNNSSSVGPVILTFVNGIIETGSNTWVLMPTSSTCLVGASPDRYVKGIFGRGMNSSAGTEKRFDIGDENGYRPLLIRSATGSGSGHYVFARLIEGNANTGTSTLSGGIDSVSRYRYYEVGYVKGASGADSMNFQEFTPTYNADDGLYQNQTGVMVAFSPDHRATWINAGPSNHVVDLSAPPTELQSNTISPVLTVRRDSTFHVALAFGPSSGVGLLPDIANGSYGPHPLNKFDLWKAPSDSATPLLVYIHGGGLTSGSKADISSSLLTKLLAAGISVMSINYRLTPEVIFPQHFLDCARAIQYARHHAVEFNIDRERIGAGGSSAGGLTSFWLAFHDDLADPLNPDSVLRMSTKLRAVTCWSGQTCMDSRIVVNWIGPLVLQFTSYFAGPIYGLPADSMQTPTAFALEEQASPTTHLTVDDPPAWMYYSYVNPPANSSEAIHHVNFGLHLQSMMDTLGITSVVLTPAYTGSITDSATNFLVRYLKYPATPTTVTVNVPLDPSWNMISNPVTTAADSVRQLFPTSSSAYAFQFNPATGYTQTYRMANGVGYWEKFPATTLQTITGLPRSHDSINVVAGWNMVGSISNPVDTGTIVSIPPGLRESNWFGYAAGYNAARQLTPGKAYWVKANAAGKFVLTNPGAARTPKVNTSGMKVEDGLNSLTITDSKGSSQTLYFGADETGQIPLALFGMPPAPPQGAFDARFETADGGSMVQIHAAQVSEPVEFSVAVQSDSYPLTVSWMINGGTASYQLTDCNGGKTFQSKDMRSDGSMKIANSDVNRITVRLVGDGQLPKEYALSQNYPNPFNPSTSITYALPVGSRVSVKVYNLIGQLVRTLVNETQTAGYRTAEWNGLNNEGRQVASGIYILQMTAAGTNGPNGPGTSFSDVRKLLMLK